MEALLQLLLELLLQVFLEFFFDLSLQEVGVDRRFGRIAIYSLIGAAVGGVSLAVIRHHIIERDLLRWVSLIVSPVLIGLAMQLLGKRRKERRGDEFGLESFWPSWGFAFCFGLVRLLFAR